MIMLSQGQVGLDLSNCIYHKSVPSLKAKVLYQSIIAQIRYFFPTYLHKNVCCGYLLEVPYKGASNEYPQQ